MFPFNKFVFSKEKHLNEFKQLKLASRIYHPIAIWSVLFAIDSCQQISSVHLANR